MMTMTMNASIRFACFFGAVGLAFIAIVDAAASFKIVDSIPTLHGAEATAARGLAELAARLLRPRARAARMNHGL